MMLLSPPDFTWQDSCVLTNSMTVPRWQHDVVQGGRMRCIRHEQRQDMGGDLADRIPIGFPLFFRHIVCTPACARHREGRNQSAWEGCCRISLRDLIDSATDLRVSMTLLPEHRENSRLDRVLCARRVLDTVGLLGNSVAQSANKVIRLRRRTWSSRIATAVASSGAASVAGRRGEISRRTGRLTPLPKVNECNDRI